MLLRETEQVLGRLHVNFVVGRTELIGLYLNGPGAGSACTSTMLMLYKLSLKKMSNVSKLVPVTPRFSKFRIILAS
jgi:hypothetical protein